LQATAARDADTLAEPPSGATADHDPSDP